jgi:H+-transporting ATPase
VIPLEQTLQSNIGEAPRQLALAQLSALGSNAKTGLTAAEVQSRLTRDGANDVPEEKRHPLLLFARKFSGLSAWMLELIAVLSFALGKRADFWIAVALLVVNALLSFFQEQRASAAVAALRSRLRVTARVLRDGSWRGVSAHDLVRGDVVRLRSGDFVPADVQVIEGDVEIDQSALTGESAEQKKSADDTLFSGSMVRQGEAMAVVIETGARTYFGKTTHLVESAHPKLHIEEVITRVVKWLFLIVGILVAITIAVSLMSGGKLIEILPLSLVLLMSAVPIALPVMFTVSMAIGSIELARRGALVTRLSAAEDAATMDVACADKTGTLTLSKLALASVQPQPGFVAEDVIRDGALASNEANQDAIDLAFLRAAQDRKLLADPIAAISFVPFSAKTRRTEAVVEIAGRRVRVMKGALRTIAEVVGLDASQTAALDARANEEAKKGFRVLAVAREDSEAVLRLVGLAFLYDAPRPESRQLIDELRTLGVTVKMLTGDALPVARVIARELGLGEIVRAPELRSTAGDGSSAADRLVERSSGFAEVFPEDKFLVVKRLQKAGHIVGMTGDGVNDAPALRQAEVGIAVESATDVAKGAASVVLTTEGLGAIVDLVRNGRAICQRVLTWIINKVSRTILKAGFVVIAFLVTGKFVISALGMVLLVFMTDFVKIALATDHTRPSQKPESWNIAPLVALAVMLGLAMLVEALAVLFAGWRLFHLGSNTGQLQTFSFELLLFFALFSIVSIRERHAWWSSWPSKFLCLGLCADACAGVAVSSVGLGELAPLPPRELLFVVAAALGCSLIVNDIVKTGVIARYWNKGGMDRTAVA